MIPRFSSATPGRWLAQTACLGLLVLTACQGPQADSDALALFEGGSISRLDVERSLRERGLATKPDDLVDVYRSEARRLALHEILSSRAAEATESGLMTPSDDEAGSSIREEYERRSVVVDVLLDQQNQLQPPAVNLDDVASFYEEHHEAFHRPAQRYTWHLFRRQREGETLADVEELLKSLKARAQAGETFAQLATQYSDSETQKFSGRLGWIERGRVAPAIEELIFGLEERGISDPVALPGGAALFQVTEIVTEQDYPIADVQLAIAKYLRGERLRAEVAASLQAAQEPPEGSTVLEIDVLADLMATSIAPEDSAPTVLNLGDLELDARAFRAVFETEVGDLQLPWKAEYREQLERVYRQVIDNQLLWMAAEAAGFPRTSAEREAFDQRMQRRNDDQRIESFVRQQIYQRIDADEDQLRQFYADNDFLFQSPLRLQIETLSVDATKDAAKQMASLGNARERLMAGETTFEEVAKALDGRSLEARWVGPAGLRNFDPKVRFYITELNSTGYTIPFQLNRQLNMIWVRERQEPSVLPFDQVKPRVRAEFFNRHSQRLYQELSERLLEEHDFVFRAQELESLGSSEAADPPSS